MPALFILFIFKAEVNSNGIIRHQNKKAPVLH